MREPRRQEGTGLALQNAHRWKWSAATKKNFSVTQTLKIALCRARKRRAAATTSLVSLGCAAKTAESGAPSGPSFSTAATREERRERESCAEEHTSSASFSPCAVARERRTLISVTGGRLATVVAGTLPTPSVDRLSAHARTSTVTAGRRQRVRVPSCAVRLCFSSVSCCSERWMPSSGMSATRGTISAWPRLAREKTAATWPPLAMGEKGRGWGAVSSRAAVKDAASR
mmetsp:Transcript_1491/g.5272  ORF Transcript_1491/g.5272 Transcript_1491/m.5272 type:complete len:229 (-) Transcript_1491:900-1586(-)